MITGSVVSQQAGLNVPCWMVHAHDVPYVADIYLYRIPHWLVYTCPECLDYTGMVPGTDNRHTRELMDEWLTRHGWEGITVYRGDKTKMRNDRYLQCTHCANFQLAGYWRTRSPEAALRCIKIADDFEASMQCAYRPAPPAPNPGFYSGNHPFVFANLPQVQWPILTSQDVDETARLIGMQPKIQWNQYPNCHKEEHRG